MQFSESDENYPWRKSWWNVVSDLHRALSTNCGFKSVSASVDWSCVKQVLLSDSQVIRGHWSDILLSSKICRGILRCLEDSSDLSEINQGIECITVLVHSGIGIKTPSQIRPSEKCDWRTFSFVEDYRNSCTAIFESLYRVIVKLTAISPNSFYARLAEFVRVYPWNSQLINQNQELSSRLFNLLLFSRTVSSGLLCSLAELFRFVPSDSLNHSHLEVFSHACTDCDPSDRLNTLYAFNYLIRKVSPRHQGADLCIAALIQEAILLYDSSTDSISTACLENLALLDHVTSEVEEKIHNLLVTSTATESLLYGIGKASRRNSKNLAMAHRLVVPIINDMNPEIRSCVALTQCIGDILFSDVLQLDELLEDSLCLLDVVSRKLHRRTEAPVALRTFMTGYARMIEAGIIRNHKLLVAIDESFRGHVEDTIESAVSDSQMNERFVADLLRSVGLIDSIKSQAGLDWKSEGTISKSLRAGLVSRKTQIVLGSLSSLGKRVPLHEDEITAMVEENLSALEARSSWDFHSAPVISGCLHVVLEGCRKFPIIHADVVKRIEKMISKVKESRVEQYSSAIRKHQDGLRQLLLLKHNSSC